MKLITTQITGRWEAVQMEGRTVEGWRLFRYYEPNNFTWFLTPHGVLLERINGRPDFETLYFYSPENHTLHIDRARYNPGHYMSTVCITNLYRIEPISDNECWAYDLTDVENAPDECRFRIKMRNYGCRL